MPITKGSICLSILWGQEQVKYWHLQGIKCTGALMFHKHMQASCQAFVTSRSVDLSTASMQVMGEADADSFKLPMLAGQQAFLNNTYVYSIGDFPLSEKDYKTAFRSVKLPHL